MRSRSHFSVGLPHPVGGDAGRDGRRHRDRGAGERGGDLAEPGVLRDDRDCGRVFAVRPAQVVAVTARGAA